MSKGKYSEKELCLIWLDSFMGLEYKHKSELYNLIKGKTDIRKILIDGKSYIETELGEEKYSLLLASANGVYLNYVLDGLKRRDVVVVTAESDNYPETLKNTSLPPLVLYCKGDLSLFNKDCFAIVGSRKSLPISIKLAEDYTKAVSEAGLIPVTGIAEGVDKAVIDGALKGGGKVISVLAGGFDNVYPKSHEGLVEKIIENGLVVTEYPPEVCSRAYFFPIRNRIIAGLSKGTLIVSAGKKSGTTYTAEYAEEYGRDLFAVPYGVGVSSGEGCNDLIKRGAMLTDTPDDILNFYGLEKPNNGVKNLTELELKIIKILSDGEMHIEKIASALNEQAYEITPTLSIMEIKGIIVKTGVNIFGLTRLDLEE